MSEINIKASIRVPTGKTCHYKNIIPCAFLKAAATYKYCIVFGAALSAPYPTYYVQKCPACLMACNDEEMRLGNGN